MAPLDMSAYPIIGKMFEVVNFYTVVGVRCMDRECDGKTMILLGGGVVAVCPKCGSRYQCVILEWDAANPGASKVGVVYNPPANRKADG